MAIINRIHTIHPRLDPRACFGRGLRLTPILVLGLLPLLLLAGCRTEHKWHQKATLVVETPTGLRSGSSVVEVTARCWTVSEPGSLV